METVKEMVDWTEMRMKRIIAKAANPPECVNIMREVIMELHMLPQGQAMLLAASFQCLLWEMTPGMGMAFSIELQKSAGIGEKGN